MLLYGQTKYENIWQRNQLPLLYKKKEEKKEENKQKMSKHKHTRKLKLMRAASE